MVFVLDSLSFGNYREALNSPPDIDALLCVAEEKDLHDTECLYHKIPIVDMQPIPAGQLTEAIRWIKENIGDHRIMVFCNAGIGRSPSVVIAYLCCVMGYSFGEAVEYVAKRKPEMSILPMLIENIEAAMEQIKKI